MNRTILSAAFALAAIPLCGCVVSYTTPGGAAGIKNLVNEELADAEIAELMKVEPASPFPARIAVARVQASGYATRTNSGYGHGRYTVVTTRDIEEEADFERVAGLPMIAGLAPVSRLLLPSKLGSIKDLRLSAARIKTDLLLLYSVDTKFHVEGDTLMPLSTLSLGLLPTEKAYVASTIAGALIDVRSGYVYGAAESTKKEEKRATVWNSRAAVDKARIIAERAAFKDFVEEFARLWANVVAQYGG